jgi:probable phosphoglycerate mutase
MANIYLVRHGDAVGTKGKFHGMKDVPLTKEGVDEAVHIGDKLSKSGIQFKKIFASPLSRTRDTAEIISEATGLPVELRHELLPLDLGEYVGKSTDTYKEDVQHYLKNPKEQIPNGGTVDGWAKNYIPFTNHFLFDKTDDNYIFVTHGRNILLTKADMKLGNNYKYDNDFLAKNDISTEHGGYAVANGDRNQFQIVNPRKTAAGVS